MSVACDANANVNYSACKFEKENNKILFFLFDNILRDLRNRCMRFITIIKILINFKDK